MTWTNKSNTRGW